MLHNFTFQQIEAFLTIARYQSITKACDILYISQPALSKILRRFEENFGTPLFTRTNQGVTLTSEGKMLYSRLNPLYSDLDTVFHSMQDLVGPEDRFLHLSLPICFDFCEDFAPVRKLIQQYKETYPEVKVIESVLDLNRFQHCLDVGFCDVILAPEYSVSLDKKVATKRICEMPQYILTASHHPLAQGEELDYSLLGDVTFLAMPYQDSVHSKNVMAAICRQNGFLPKTIECPPNYATALHSAHIGNSMTITWKLDSPLLKYYPLKNPASTLPIVAAWNPEKFSRATQLFLSMI